MRFYAYTSHRTLRVKIRFPKFNIKTILAPSGRDFVCSDFLKAMEYAVMDVTYSDFVQHKDRVMAQWYQFFGLDVSTREGGRVGRGSLQDRGC